MDTSISQQIEKWDSIRKTLSPPKDILHYIDPTPSFISIVNQVPHIREEEATTNQIREHLTNEHLVEYSDIIRFENSDYFSRDDLNSEEMRVYGWSDMKITKARLLQRFTTCHFTNPPDLELTTRIEKEIEELEKLCGDDMWEMVDLDEGLDNIIYLMTWGILYNDNAHPIFFTADTDCLGYKMSQYYYIRSISYLFSRWGKSTFSFT